MLVGLKLFNLTQKGYKSIKTVPYTTGSSVVHLKGPDHSISYCLVKDSTVVVATQDEGKLKKILERFL